MRSFRADFTKGISAVVEPHLLGDGYAVMVDNADMSAFAASSYRAPVFRMNVPAGTVHVFEYRGKWWFSTEHRQYAAEFIGTQERLYYTESGHLPGIGKPAMKIIDGVSARLGLPRPSCPATVETDVVASPGAFTVEVGTDGSSFDAVSNTYRLGYRTSDGLLPAGEAITLAIPKGKTAILKWSTPTMEGVLAVVVYGRTSGKEQILDEVTPDVVQFVDNGSLSPHGEYASNLDSSDVFYYFHTFLRDVNGHIDESGPSPLTRQVDTGKIRRITRTPLFEGLLDASSTVTGAPSSKTATQLEICGSCFRAVGSRRIITTKTDHGFKAGDEIGVLPKHAALESHTPKQVYKVALFDADLPAPTITYFGAGSTSSPVWAAGTLLKAKVTAFRGSGWGECFGGAPAESLPSVEAQWTTTAAKGLIQWSFPSGDADGFHVYLNDKWVATVPAGVLFLEFATLTGDATRPVPTVNLSRSRAFHFSEDAAMTWDAALSAQAPLGWGALAKTVETKIGRTAHGRSVGDLLTFSGYKEIDGPHLVSRIGNADEFYIKTLTEVDDTSSPHRTYLLTRPAFQYVDKWALYVQRGATEGVPLQQGVYPIDQLEVIDTKPVQSLSVTCDSSYYAQTPEGPVLVEFDPPPLGIHGLVLHNQCLWGIRGNAVVWGPVNRPDAWPDAFQRNFPFPPVALASYAGALLVLLPNGIGRFDGTDPANLSFSMTAARDGCIAPNSVQHTAAGLMYLSTRGVMAFQAELNTSIPITDGKLEASIFCAASSTIANVWPAWWIPTRDSAAWAKCTRELPAASHDQRERVIDDTLPAPGVLEDIRSFYWRGRYYLYFTGENFGRHGTILVDTTRRTESGYPVFHLGLRPTHAHVTDRDHAFVLLDYHTPPSPPAPPATTVSITRPA